MRRTKLLALLAVGVFVVWGLAGGVDQALAQIDRSALGQWQVEGGRWAALTLLLAPLICLLPGSSVRFAVLRLLVLTVACGAAAWLSRGEPNPYGY